MTEFELMDKIVCVTCQKAKDYTAFYKSNHRHCKKCLIKVQRQRYAIDKTPVIAQAKMLRVLHMTIYLMRGRHSVVDFSARFDISVRTGYRYLKLIESMDFGLEQDFNNNFFVINDPCPLCGGKHKSRENKRQDVHQSSFTNPAFFN